MHVKTVTKIRKKKRKILLLICRNRYFAVGTKKHLKKFMEGEVSMPVYYYAQRPVAHFVYFFAFKTVSVKQHFFAEMKKKSYAYLLFNRFKFS